MRFKDKGKGRILALFSGWTEIATSDKSGKWKREASVEEFEHA